MVTLLRNKRIARFRRGSASEEVMEYGMREFGVLDPNSYCLAFTEATQQAAAANITTDSTDQLKAVNPVGTAGMLCHPESRNAPPKVVQGSSDSNPSSAPPQNWAKHQPGG